ncbi:phosphoribosyl-AMP cyclohydrolase [Halorubrum sp. JWXQ-INN 858]|uniref:phosphoribosyl-AMP cyclohydrolase n=1 Tax=Halorubrum sp. JWXQ-INN 858 TaxID=2690782 RepID=UPI0013568B38|nr:phosphoribosyl-AMP cyclohydrolase [Halorubrum sp. JWXQ-INN 858]MWV63908.1 phosphoribosyl-AMP cyclohydrolase [Halorubrum sp. JWXQ-INN 858]
MTDADATEEPGTDTTEGPDADAVTASDDAVAGIDVDFGDDGLVPAIAQDADSGEVLMLAYVSPEALERTRETGQAHYYSRSRDELWLKGGSSGHTQAVAEVRVDCDADALLYVVDQSGGACHTGYRSCFHRTVDGEEVGERVFDPDEVY